MFLLSQSERDDFEELIRDAGFEEDDFELIESEEQPTSSEPNTMNGIVLVR